ncbi:DUF4834 family protein [Bacteroides acidifaciens]|uniref:DUF4834 family protein n=1 Tax=Bacteroides acidifaciens TaxID=85831 RepID=UPI0025996528|nr:DUF4834 family protein [uncultured Bacteroides sp.]
MYILLFILIFIIAIVVFGLSIIGFLLRAIFGIGRRSSSSSRPKQAESGRTATGQQEYGQIPQNPTDNEEEIYSENVSGRRHKKIFTQDDGEYVDFEEIKE